MTSGVKPALPQILMLKPNADRQLLRDRANERDFGEALGIAKKGKHETAGKQPAEAEPRWPRFGTRLDAAINKTSVLGSKLSPKVAEPDVSEASADEDIASAEPKSAAAEDADAAASLPLPGIQIPPEQARRMSGDDGGEPTPRNAPAAKSNSDVAAISTDGSAIAPTDDDGDGEDSVTPVRDDGKAADRAGNTGASKAIDIAKADAKLAAAPPEQAPKPRFAVPASEPANGDALDRPAVNQARDQAEPAKVVARTTVVSEQSFPAPIQPTAIALADSLASSGALIPASERPAVDAIRTPIAPAPAQSLKIQLHPAELGMVTATLRFAGEQLSIELKVENNEAYQRLSTDSETIVKSLRGLGYDIDRVTVIQPLIAQNAPVRPDGSAAISAQPGRGGEQFGSGATSGGSGGTGGQQPGGDGANARHGGQKNAPGNMDRAGGGIYI